MKINNQKLKSDISIELEDDDMVKLWNELEFLSDKDLIERESHLMKLKIMIKENVFKLDKALTQIGKQS